VTVLAKVELIRERA